MANNPDVTVAVEAAVHKGIERVLDRIWEKHHLRVTQIVASWPVPEFINKDGYPDYKVGRLEITSVADRAEES